MRGREGNGGQCFAKPTHGVEMVGFGGKTQTALGLGRIFLPESFLSNSTYWMRKREP